jgi:hypothetical protein
MVRAQSLKCWLQHLSRAIPWEAASLHDVLLEVITSSSTLTALALLLSTSWACLTPQLSNRGADN